MVVPQRAHLEKQALWRADTTAIYDVDSDTEVSYADLNERANRLANARHDRGVRYNDRVGLQVFNTVAFPVALYGCFKLGAVPVVLNYRLTAEDNAHVLETVNEQAFVFDAATADLASRLRIQRSWGLEVGTLGDAFEHAGFSGSAQVDLGAYEHDHRSVGGPTGLSDMSRDVGAALLRVVTEHGVDPDYDRLGERYRETAESLVAAYATDAAFNGLDFDREGERDQVDTYAEAVAPPPTDARLPAWRDAPIDPTTVREAATADREEAA